MAMRVECMCDIKTQICAGHSELSFSMWTFHEYNGSRGLNLMQVQSPAQQFPRQGL